MFNYYIYILHLVQHALAILYLIMVVSTKQERRERMREAEAPEWDEKDGNIDGVREGSERVTEWE